MTWGRRIVHMGRGERGSGTVLAVAVVGVISILLVGALTVAGAVLGAHRARAAADLAALAAAASLAWAESTSIACAQAATTARLNGADLTSCAVDGAEAWVTTRATVPFLPWSARGLARAGPPR